MNSPLPPETLPEDALGHPASVDGDVIWLYVPPSREATQLTGPFAELFGRDLENAHAPNRERWLGWIHPEDKTRVAEAFDATILTGGFDERYRILLPSGNQRWLHDRAVRLADQTVVRITADLSLQRRLEEALDAARWRNDVLVEDGADVIVVADRLGVVQEVSRSYTRLLGYRTDAVIGTRSFDRVDPENKAALRAMMEDLRDNLGGSTEFQCRVRHADGHWLWIEGTARNMLNDPHMAGIVLNYRDISARKDAERSVNAITGQLEARVEERTRQLAVANVRLRESDRLHRHIMQALPDVLMRCDRETMLLDVYGAVHQMVAAPQELLGTRLVDRPELPDTVKALWLGAVGRALESGRNQIIEYRLDVMAGRKEFEARITPIAAEEAIAIVREVTERNRLRERMLHLATHDELSGLLNRTALRERLNARIDRHRKQSVAVMVVDLDRFKQVNDTLGHAIGDTLLKIVANRITRRAGMDSLRARIGGDEFAIVLDCSDANDGIVALEQFATTLSVELGNRMRVHGESLYVTPSVGIALFPRDGEDADALLRNADIAMMRAKELGRNAYHFYDAALGSTVHSRHNTEMALGRALAHNELTCLYQPKILVQSGAVIGVEALVRWNIGGGQVLTPSRFIPLAERSGLIRALGRWVLREALRQVANFSEYGRPAVNLSINVSVMQLRDHDFVGELREALTEFKFAPERLTLEIAETAFVDDMETTADVMGEVAALGVRLSIDDFGTGYGGLSWLKNLPIHEIKIDRSFVQGCAIDAFDATIVSGLIEIAHNLGIQIVAEGVERADQIAFLTQVKCDVIQGFFLGMPMSAEELMKATRLWQSTPA